METKDQETQVKDGWVPPPQEGATEAPPEGTEEPVAATDSAADSKKSRLTSKELYLINRFVEDNYLSFAGMSPSQVAKEMSDRLKFEVSAQNVLSAKKLLEVEWEYSVAPKELTLADVLKQMENLKDMMHQRLDEAEATIKVLEDKFDSLESSVFDKEFKHMNEPTGDSDDAPFDADGFVHQL